MCGKEERRKKLFWMEETPYGIKGVTEWERRRNCKPRRKRGRV